MRSSSHIVRTLLAVVLLVAATSACKPRQRPRPRPVRDEIPAEPRLQGGWCLAADPPVFAYTRDEHPLDDVRRTMRELRLRDLVRVRVRGSAVSVDEAGTVIARGVVTSRWAGPVGTLAFAWDRGRRPAFLDEDDVHVRLEDEALRLEIGGHVEYLQRESGPACVRTTPELVRGTASAFVAPPDGSPRAAFADLPPEQWPQIVLTNDTAFREHTRMIGASAFFLRGPHGIVVATAKHLIRAAGGVVPDLPLEQFDAALERWEVFPRTRPRSSYRATRLAMRTLKEAEERDWLFLAGATATRLPATPLEPRPTPVGLGERVLLIGCEYRDEACVQHVYEGRVTGRMRDHFRVELDPPVQTRGFSGAPLVDANGALVGVLSVTFTPFGSGAGELETGGEDIASGLAFLDDSSAPSVPE